MLFATLACSQADRIYGTVTNNRKPVPQAVVAELDDRHRIVNQTRTDNNGQFTLSVSGKNSLVKVTADGMKDFMQKIGSRRKWKIDLKSASMSAEEMVRKSSRKTTWLLTGYNNNVVVTQETWVEQISDEEFCLVIPTQVFSAVEEYPAGRRVVVKDFNGRVMAVGVCIADSYVEEQETDDEGVSVFDRVYSGSSASKDTSLDFEENLFFCYPRFMFKLSELEYLIEHDREIACFEVDTSRGDNFWIYYPHQKFAKELQKILNKLLK